MGVELELAVLLALTTLGFGVFTAFEVETPLWRKLLKWSTLIGGTLLLYRIVGHVALMFPMLAVGVGGIVHFTWCRKHKIHPIHATPRRKYYALRGWPWPE